MKVIIIGDGVAGQTVAETIRKKDYDADITIITKEPYTYYSRIYLPHYIAGEKTLQSLLIRKEDWYQKQKISILLDTEVVKIEPENHHIFINGENSPIKYDKLILATGSNPRKITWGKDDIKGLFTLRNIENADEIIDYFKENGVNKALIIGGGLLGIELGYHLKDLEVEVSICEVFDYLLPRQLDKGTSEILRKYLESQGMKIICGESVQEIIGEDTVKGVKTKSGMEMHFDVILEQMGIIPEISLAKSAGLPTNRGIIVNEYMQTDDPDIYAVGDCIEFQDQIWGIIPASLEQSKLAANKILGHTVEPYSGTVWSTRLKIAGIKLSCLGAPPKEKGSSQEIFTKVDQDCYMCRKVLIDNDTLAGAILMGPGSDKYFQDHLGKKIDRKELQEHLNSD